MISITAILRVKPGHEATLRDALLEMLESVKRDEPGTIGYFISQSIDEPQVFTTYERFIDRAAMERHNSSAAVAKVIRLAEGILAEKIVLYSSNELASKQPA
jgi:quinol monooxygenase YgiN